jgi:hypothetical protein
MKITSQELEDPLCKVSHRRRAKLETRRRGRNRSRRITCMAVEGLDAGKSPQTNKFALFSGHDHRTRLRARDWSPRLRVRRFPLGDGRPEHEAVLLQLSDQIHEAHKLARHPTDIVNPLIDIS